MSLADPARPDLRVLRWRVFSGRAMLAMRDGRTGDAVADAERALAVAQEDVGSVAPALTWAGRTCCSARRSPPTDVVADARTALATAADHLQGSGGTEHPGYRKARELLARPPG